MRAQIFLGHGEGRLRPAGGAYGCDPHRARPARERERDCIWAWQPRQAGGKTETRRTACSDKLTIARVPYALERARSGVSVTVKLPDGRELSEQEVVVEDLLIVALGDSFASGESNPDRPVQFSAQREMVYDPSLLREDVASRTSAKDPAPGYGLASGDDQYNPKVLPRQRMDDELFRALSQALFAGIRRRIR